uniref:RNase H domain-containing protein n=1 Tax=Heligmosomoides polygyrus TaxID=6339 RepID=A0A183G6M2_HELPZ
LRLAVFADACAIALAACAYLFTEIVPHNGKIKNAIDQVNSYNSKIRDECHHDRMPPGKLDRRCLTSALGKLCKIYIFSDSQIALSWLGINSHHAKLGRLVENRLQEIRRISEALQLQGISLEFRHVPTTDNSADAGTRGLTSEQLKNHSWWTGPEFLLSPEDQWTSAVHPLNTDSSHKEAPVVVTFTQEHPSSSESTSMPISSVIDCARFSSFTAAKGQHW